MANGKALTGQVSVDGDGTQTENRRSAQQYIQWYPYIANNPAELPRACGTALNNYIEIINNIIPVQI